MSIATEGVKALCFDFGNTLVEFGPAQVARQYTALEGVLRSLFGHCDAERLKSIRDGQIVAPFSNGYRENDMRSICEELIRGLYGVVPDDRQVAAVMGTRYESFVDAIEAGDEVAPLLARLGRRYRLGLLSNYPCGRAIRDSLRKVGLLDVFEAVVVSGDVGYAKPHARPFEALTSQLGLAPPQCIYVGDNWLADVQGAKRMGMLAVLTSQYVPYERFEPAAGDHMPDARIARLGELEAWVRP